MAGERAPNKLREARTRRGWTQEYVAQQLNDLTWQRYRDVASVNKVMVSNWERGTKGISPRNREMLCLLFDADAVSLGLISAPHTDHAPVHAAAQESHTEPAPHGELVQALSDNSRLLEQLGPAAAVLRPRLVGVWRDELVRRRSVLKLLSLAPAAPAVLQADPSPAHVSPRDFDDLADRYQTLYHSSSPGALLAPVIAHLGAIGDALRAERTPAARSRLLANRARVAILAGRLSFFDLDDPMAARGYYNLAIEAARECGDHHQVAAALGHIAFIPAAEHGMTAALDYLDGAHDQLTRDPHGPLSSWVSAVASEFHTKAGDHTRALTAVDQAKHALSRGGLSQHLRWFDYYDGGRLAGFSGYAHLKANRYDDAASELGTALLLPLSAVKQRAVFLADLATVHYYAGDLDRSCHIATESVTELSRAGYATGADRLREFHALVSPHRSAAVQTFTDSLASLSDSTRE